MDRITEIRAAEKKYHDSCYVDYHLFEPGSWLHRPVKNVLDLLEEYQDRTYLNVLDLGSGVGRNSIPIAESMKGRDGRVVCVDLLESAIHKLREYSRKYGVEPYIVTEKSDIEQFTIEQSAYDIILAVSALEHVSSVSALKRKLKEMAIGTKTDGANCIIIGSNIREINLCRGLELDPMFEVNMSTKAMMEILDQQYVEWQVEKRLIKHLSYEIERNGELVQLTTDCITYVAKKIDKNKRECI